MFLLTFLVMTSTAVLNMQLFYHFLLPWALYISAKNILFSLHRQPGNIDLQDRSRKEKRLLLCLSTTVLNSDNNIFPDLRNI